jgi:hypothetical protein
VEDDHVDRPGVDVQQCMKLTGTNSPIGLIVLIDQCSSEGERLALALFDEIRRVPKTITLRVNQLLIVTPLCGET